MCILNRFRDARDLVLGRVAFQHGVVHTVQVPYHTFQSHVTSSEGTQRRTAMYFVLLWKHLGCLTVLFDSYNMLHHFLRRVIAESRDVNKYPAVLYGWRQSRCGLVSRGNETIRKPLRKRINVKGKNKPEIHIFHRSAVSSSLVNFP